MSGSPSRLVSRSRRLRGMSGGAAGQFEGEFTARSWAAVDEDSPAMGFGDLLDDVQADPKADEMAGSLGLDAGESPEELTLVLWVDTKSVIEHTDGPACA